MSDYVPRVCGAGVRSGRCIRFNLANTCGERVDVFFFCSKQSHLGTQSIDGQLNTDDSGGGNSHGHMFVELCESKREWQQHITELSKICIKWWAVTQSVEIRSGTSRRTTIRQRTRLRRGKQFRPIATPFCKRNPETETVQHSHVTKKYCLENCLE